MDYLAIPLRTRAAKRAKDPVNFAQYPAAVGGIDTREGNPRFRPLDSSRPHGLHVAWIESGDEIGARWLGPADKSARMDHQGWYANSFQDETTRGVVYRLPHGRFVAGASDPWNCDKDGFGPFLMGREVFTDEREAALAADRLAEIYEEFLREDDAKQQAEAQIEEKRAEVASLREDIRELIAGIRESKLAPAVCAEIRDSIRRHWQEMTAARERIHALKRNFWLAVE